MEDMKKQQTTDETLLGNSVGQDEPVALVDNSPESTPAVEDPAAEINLSLTDYPTDGMATEADAPSGGPAFDDDNFPAATSVALTDKSSLPPSNNVFTLDAEDDPSTAPIPLALSSINLESQAADPPHEGTPQAAAAPEENSEHHSRLRAHAPPTLESPFFQPSPPVHASRSVMGSPALPTSNDNSTPATAPGSPLSPHPMDYIKPPLFLQVDESYRSLVFTDGFDSHGRPVIVLNTSALPPRSRKDEALNYLRDKLAPIVNEGPYVLVLVACTSGPNYKSLPALWTVSAYRSLARPFHKNVKFVIMVNPSLLVRAVLAVLKPFIKQKAFWKLKKVKSLPDLDVATNGEVRLEHLGQAFLTSMRPSTT